MHFLIFRHREVSRVPLVAQRSAAVSRLQSRDKTAIRVRTARGALVGSVVSEKGFV
jgi:hypothetical protein